MHRTRNAAYGQPYRGFESLPLRQDCFSLSAEKSYGRIKFTTFPVVGWVDKTPFLKAIEAGGTSNAADPAVTEAIENEKQERAAKPARRSASLAETF